MAQESTDAIYHYTPFTTHLDAQCHVIIKAYILTGDDVVSKVGTKHVALSYEPLMLTNTLSDNEVSIAQAPTFNQ